MGTLNYISQALTVDGGANGVLTVTSTFGMAKDAVVHLSSATQPTQELLIDSVLSTTTIAVKPRTPATYTRFNASAYTVADSATVVQPEQNSFYTVTVESVGAAFFKPDDVTVAPLTVAGLLGQVANLQNWVDSTGANLAHVSPSGDGSFTSFSQTAGTFSVAATGALDIGPGNFTVAATGALDIGPGNFAVAPTGHITLDATDASGTPGAVIMNKPSGIVAVDALASSVVVTNSLVVGTSIVLAVLQDNTDAVEIRSVVPAAGSFTVNLTGATTAARKVGFVVFN